MPLSFLSSPASHEVSALISVRTWHISILLNNLVSGYVWYLLWIQTIGHSSGDRDLYISFHLSNSEIITITYKHNNDRQTEGHNARFSQN